MWSSACPNSGTSIAALSLKGSEDMTMWSLMLLLCYTTCEDDIRETLQVLLHPSVVSFGILSLPDTVFRNGSKMWQQKIASRRDILSLSTARTKRVTCVLQVIGTYRYW